MIAYDTNVLIYALESSSTFALKARQVILEAEATGAVVSILVKQEILTGSLLMGESLNIVEEALGSLTGTKWLNVDNAVVVYASKLTQKYGVKLKGYDAIIIATAILGKADKFYTNDKLLIDLNIQEIAVCSI